MMSRRQAREITFQILFGLDGNPALDVEAALHGFFHHLEGGRSEDEEDAEKSSTLDRPLAEGFVRQVIANVPELDDTISHVSRNWRIERMARVDRNILRLAVYELIHCPDIPSRVTMNEAIELAKRFGAADGPPFVNGLLDSLVKTLGIQK